MTAGQQFGVAWGTLVLVALGVVLWSVTFPVSGSNTPAALPLSVPSSGQSDPAWATLAAIEATRLATETMPTPTATMTATARPTSTQQVVWQPEPCSTPEPGQLCRVPDRAPPTPPPYPSCYQELEPGRWCRWIVADEAADARSEVK